MTTNIVEGLMGPAAEQFPASELPGEDTAEGRRCRETASTVVRAFIELMEEASVGGSIAIADARRIGQAIMAAQGPLSDYYARAQANCFSAFANILVDQRRTEVLGRLITSTFEPLLDHPDGIERATLPQLFAAVRLMLGEEDFTEMKATCSTLVERFRDDDGVVDWQAYYDCDQAALMLEKVLVGIAKSFRRFEPRKDWFLIVMGSSPNAVSIASSAFIPKRPDEKATQNFTDVNFCHLFDALFASVRLETFDAQRTAAFTERWGADPKTIFGRLFVELASLRQRVVD